MRKSFILLAFITFFQSAFIYGDDFQAYLHFTNKAELYIVDGQFILAQKAFDTAFIYWQKPFAIDLSNYLRCANSNKDYKAVKATAAQLISLGCEMSFFSSPVYLTEFRKSALWVDLVNAYPDLRQKFISKNNWTLRSKIERLLALDQSLRQQDPNYTVLKDSIYKSDKLIEKEVVAILQQAFPNEYNCGIYFDNDTTIAPYGLLHIVILHNYIKIDEHVAGTISKTTYNFTKLLSDAVAKGQMHPQEFIYLNDRSVDYKLGDGFGQDGLLINIDGKLYHDNYTPVYQKKYDDARKKIGLNDIASERKKACFNANNSEYIFFRHMGYIIKFTGITFTEKQMKLFVYTGVNVKPKK